MIPKIIHYCWLSEDPVPAELQNYIASWKKYLKDYEFIKWDFTRFDKNSSVWVQEAFDNKKYAFACDYIRLYALYHMGGIYMDMDIEVLKSFDKLLDKNRMMAKERPDQNWIEAGCFGAEKEDPFLYACLKYYENKHFINEKGVFEDTPLPRIMSKVYDENKYSFELYNWHYFTNKSYETGKIETTQKSYAIHHFAGSWKSAEEQTVIKNAIHIRSNIPIIGPTLAFVYEKGFKSKEAIKNGGLKELEIRVKRFLFKS